ncbi:MAG: glycosyltransferase family 2 protein [Ilumatobacteraceae bacterium]
MGVAAGRRSSRRDPLIDLAYRLLLGSNALLAVPVVYLGGLTAVAVVSTSRGRQAGRRRPKCGERLRTRFAVVIPAHDEQDTIGRTLASLANSSYPSGLFAVHVVADNCSDATAEVAAGFGVLVHVRDDPSSRGKGPALNWLMDELRPSQDEFDAVIFIDADTVVDSGFLAEMDRQLQSGAHVVQGRYEVAEAFESPATAIRWCALACRHHLRPLGRTALGGSCGLFGNGMAMTKAVALERRWTGHLVEDIEFQLDLLLHGVDVVYAPHARVMAEMPNTLAASVTQHQRWERGRFEIVASHGPRLVRSLMRAQQPGPSRRLATADALIDLAVPPLSILTAGVVASTGVGLALTTFGAGRGSSRHALGGPIMLAVIGVHVAAGLKLMDAPRAAYRSLLHAPVLVAWKVSLLLRAVGTTDSEWIRTRRNTGGPS